jgi:uncharacterized membrane protein YsdA (DUF1294 family)/cold shock CspA family protein
MLVKGKITQWDDDKGFGFIQPLLKGQRVFVHIKALQNRARQAVTFAGEKRKLKAARAASRWPLLLVLVFVAVLLAAVVIAELPLYVPIFYAGISLLTFTLYWWDKRKAQAGHSHKRTPESTLQFMALLGGWPGALLAQGYLRHKSQKRSFLAVFYLSLLLNLAALGWLLNSSLLPDIKI